MREDFQLFCDNPFPTLPPSSPLRPVVPLILQTISVTGVQDTGNGQT